MHPQVRRGVAGARATSRRPARSRAAYTDSFLLNVYPYGTVFTDSSGELNAPGAWMAAERFEARGYRAQDLSEAGAPDHLDLFLGFLDHLSGDARKETELFSDFTRWAPVCCLAVERETSAHPVPRPRVFWRPFEPLLSSLPPQTVAAGNQTSYLWARSGYRIALDLSARNLKGEEKGAA